MRWDDIIRVGDTESDHRCPVSAPSFLQNGENKQKKKNYIKEGGEGGRILVGSMQEGDIFLLVATVMSKREGGGAAMRVLRERGVFWLW